VPWISAARAWSALDMLASVALANDGPRWLALAHRNGLHKLVAELGNVGHGRLCQY
jgi:hypothetical protein